MALTYMCGTDTSGQLDWLA